jgi:cell division protein FtsN
MIFLLAGLASLTLIIAVAYFFFSRDQGAKPAVAPTTVSAPATTPLPDTFDPVEWSRQPQTPGASGLTPGATDTPDGGFVVTMPQEPSATTVPPPDVSLPPTTTTTKTPVPVGQVAFPETTTKAPTTNPKTVAKPAAPKAAKPVKTITVTEYWIQVGAFKDRFQADAVARTLEDQGLKGTLTTASIAGANVVRVRVGPYTNQDEAKKFLAWVKPVKGLEESYITATKATRTQ